MADGGFRKKLERDATQAILINAFFRWESALILAVTIILTVFFAILGSVFIPYIGGPVLGIGVFAAGMVAETAFLLKSLFDERRAAGAVSKLFKKEFNPARLNSRKSRQRLKKAQTYIMEVESAIAKTPQGPIRDRMTRTIESMQKWVEAIYRMSTRIDAYEGDRIISQDLRSVPVAIANLRRKLAVENDPPVREQIERTIADKERQMEQLTRLKNTIERAEYQMESTLSAMGTVYAQLQMLGTARDSEEIINRLQDNIDEQVDSLQDLNDAMDEMYTSSA